LLRVLHLLRRSPSSNFVLLGGAKAQLENRAILSKSFRQLPEMSLNVVFAYCINGICGDEKYYYFFSTVYQINKMTLRRRETEYRNVTFSVKANELSFFERFEKRTVCPGVGTEEKSTVS
jgi:hypothetical protein